MLSRRQFVRSVGVGVTAIGGAPSTADATHDGEIRLDLPTETLENYGYVTYSPASRALNNAEETETTNQARFRTQFYHKKELSDEIVEKTDGELTLPGAVFFVQELRGDWSGPWRIDSSVTEPGDVTVNNTNNIDLFRQLMVGLVNIDISIGPIFSNNEVGISEKTVENKTVVTKQEGRNGDSGSVVPGRALHRIITTYDSLLRESGCFRFRRGRGLWEDMRVLKEFGKKAIGHTNEISRYSKPGYLMAHWTYNAEWQGASDWGESVDGDLFNSQVDVRGYLSVESKGNDRYLGVGGFYLNEDTIEFADGYLGSMDVELQADSLQNELIGLMQNTYLRSNTNTT